MRTDVDGGLGKNFAEMNHRLGHPPGALLLGGRLEGLLVVAAHPREHRPVAAQAELNDVREAKVRRPTIITTSHHQLELVQEEVVEEEGDDTERTCVRGWLRGGGQGRRVAGGRSS